LTPQSISSIYYNGIKIVKGVGAVNSKVEVIYEGKLYTVYYKYDSGYLEIQEIEGLYSIKLVHQREVTYK
jgi:hypothetical protein